MKTIDHCAVWLAGGRHELLLRCEPDACGACPPGEEVVALETVGKSAEAPEPTPERSDART